MNAKLKLSHPGQILKDEIIVANQLTVTEAAKLLGVSRQALSNVINGKNDISPDMAYRVSKVFGGTPDIWINLQAQFNIQEATDKLRHIKLAPYRPRKAV